MIPVLQHKYYKSLDKYVEYKNFYQGIFYKTIVKISEYLNNTIQKKDNFKNISNEIKLKFMDFNNSN